MKSDFLVVVLSMEMLMPGFPEPARSANFKGGLGILIGDEVPGFARLGIGADFIVPCYSYYKNLEEKICYDFLSSKNPALNIPVNGKYAVPVSVLDINEGSAKIHGLVSPSLDFLYTLDRWQRLRQEVVFGKTIPVLLKSLGLKPDIILANESHTAVAISEIKEDPDFKGTKIVFAIHTKHGAGLEKFPEQWFDESGIRQDHRSIFVRDGCIDFAAAAADLADGIITVSDEFCQIVKEEIFPKHCRKTVGVRNGSNRGTWLSARLKKAEESGENIDLLKLWTIHQADKKELLDFVKQKTGAVFCMTKPLVGWVRRITDFKNQLPMLSQIIKAVCAERGEMVQTSLGSLSGLGMQMFCAGTASADDYRSWIETFHRWTKDPVLRGDFAFLEEYNFELLKMTGYDLWLHCPWPGWEACGTSTPRHYMSGEPALTTRTGGDMEFVQEFDPKTGQGNGFYIDPYEPMTVYQKLKVYSDIYYDWQEYGIPTLLTLNKNAYETGKTLDITDMIKEYQEKVFAPLLNSG